MASEPHTVREVMSTALRTVAAGDPLDLAARRLEEHGVRQVLVVDDEGRLAGLLSYRAVLGRAAGSGADAPAVRALMDPSPPTFTPDTPLVDAVERMLAGDFSAAVVVEGDRPVGVLSEHDVMGLTRRLLEEAGW